MAQEGRHGLHSGGYTLGPASLVQCDYTVDIHMPKIYRYETS